MLSVEKISSWPIGRNNERFLRLVLRLRGGLLQLPDSIQERRKVNNLSDTTEPGNDSSQFDALAKEQQLRQESSEWDTSKPEEAQEGDIPVIDLQEYFQTGSDAALDKVAGELRTACEETGFLSIIGHGVAQSEIDEAFAQTEAFHASHLDVKQQILMDRPDWPVGGMGYLPLKNRKLPARDTGNVNEAFIIKIDDKLTMDSNQWPAPAELPTFRQAVENYANAMENLGKRMLPVYARALDMPGDFFEEAFIKPLYRLRMTHYPAVPRDPENAFGISPHVDTSFFTILAQNQPGLTIFSERRKVWINAPLIPGAFIVNTGELLKQWTNDRFLSTRHFANNNNSSISRYSIPFFFNANPHYKMTCVPSCCSADNPAKYQPISYAESQGVVQGE